MRDDRESPTFERARLLKILNRNRVPLLLLLLCVTALRAIFFFPFERTEKGGTPQYFSGFIRAIAIAIAGEGLLSALAHDRSSNDLRGGEAY
jgi:hypothetical protein